MTTHIVPLAQHPELVETVAGWLWGEWGKNMPGSTVATVASRLRMPAQDNLPQTFVLLENGVPAATAGLVRDDLESRPDLSPWLADMFVPPAFRGRGHAVRLVRHVEQAAAAAGHATLWLNTEHAAGLYAKLGWLERGPATHNGHFVMLMRRDLRAGL